jgi:hypothetical protein
MLHRTDALCSLTHRFSRCFAWLQQARLKQNEAELRIAELEVQLDQANEQLEVVSVKASDATLELERFKQTLVSRDDSHEGLSQQQAFLIDSSIMALSIAALTQIVIMACLVCSTGGGIF